MKIQSLHPNFQRPVRSSDYAGGYDLFMPEGGYLTRGEPEALKVGLGFAAEVPINHVAMLLPRSGKGAKLGLALNNTAGVIDPDYRGEWFAFLRLHNDEPLAWEAGERLLQMLIVPVTQVELLEVNQLSKTVRGAGGFGSTGK